MKHVTDFPASIELLLFRALPGHYALLLPDDPRFTVLGVTDNYLKLVGRTREELVGRPLLEPYPEKPGEIAESQKTALASLQTAVRTGQTQNFSFQYDITDGNGQYEERHWKICNQPVTDANGTLVYILHTAEDVTSQVKAASQEAAIRDMEQRYRELAQAPVLLCIFKGTDHRIAMANEATLRFWRRTSDIVNRTLSEVMPEAAELGLLQIMDRVRESGQTETIYAYPMTLQRKEGRETLYLDLIFQPYLEPGAAVPSGVVVVAHDQTEQVRAREKAEESEQRFRDLLESADVATAVYLGGEMRIQYANEAMMRLWGRDAAVTGRTLREVLPELEGQPFHDLLYQVYTTGETYWGKEDRADLVVNGQLKTFYFNFTYKALRHADGSIYGILNMATDVTEQVLARQKVEASEQRFQNLVRSTSVGIVVLTGANMRVDVVNDAYARLIGRKADDLLHQDLFSIIPEAEAVFRPVIDGVRLSARPLHLYDQPYQVYADGKTIEGYLNLVYQPYRESDGIITGVMVLCQDVTPQVLARKQVEEAQETAQLAAEAAGLGTFDVDLVTNTTVASERLNEIFDITGSDDRNRYVDAIHPEDQWIRTQAYEQAYKNGLLEYEARVLRKNLSIRWVRIKGRIFFEEEKPAKMVGVVQDITEEKMFAEELSRKVKEHTREMEQFLFVSHHDLQEPLRKIILFSDMLKEEIRQKLPETSQLRFEKVVTAAKRMSAALRDLLDFASLNKEEEAREWVDLNEVLDDVRGDLELIINETGATLRADELPSLRANRRQLYQLFYNLVSNGVKFARPGERPMVSIQYRLLSVEELRQHPELEPGRQHLGFTVSDNGIGFDQAMAEKIFTLFQRLHSKDRYPGTGIGLALCRKVVQNHRGKIWAESRVGEGARFVVILPVV